MVCGIRRSSKKGIMKSNEVISGMGTGFELVRALIHSLKAHGNEEAHSKYLASPELQAQVARLIVGGPWEIVGTVFEETIQHGCTIRGLFRHEEGEEGGVGVREGACQPGSNLEKTIFTVRNVPDATNTLTRRYKIVHAPQKESEIPRLLEENPGFTHTTEKEVFMFGRRRFRRYKNFSLVSFGVQTPDGWYPDYEDALGFSSFKTDNLIHSPYLIRPNYFALLREKD